MELCEGIPLSKLRGDVQGKYLEQKLLISMDKIFII